MGEVESLLQKYEDKPLLKALVQSVTIPVKISQDNTSYQIEIPVGLVFDAAMSTLYQNLRAKRLGILFEELEKGETILSIDLIKSEEFFHRFLITTNAALKTYQDEKIRRFARLLIASTSSNSFSGMDDYEELLSILDELSDREFWILATLERYEMQFSLQPDENEFQQAKRFWQKFIYQIKNDLCIPQDEVDSSLIRLPRSGCYQLFAGNWGGNTQNIGRLTSRYYRLSKLVKERGDFLRHHKQ